MSDLISRNEALALIESMMETYWDRKQILSIVRNNIEKLPSAEPKKGSWSLHKSGALFICSVCEQTSLRTERYCPNCGARMEVSDE